MISKRLEQRMLRTDEHDIIPTNVRVRYTLVMNTEIKDVAVGVHGSNIEAYLTRHNIRYDKDERFVATYRVNLTRQQILELAELPSVRDMTLGQISN